MFRTRLPVGFSRSGAVLALGLLLPLDGARAAVSPSAETVIVAPASAATAGRGGVATVFGAGAFDALLQPALLASVRSVSVETSWSVDRYPLDGAEPWAFGVVLPLGGPDASLPRLTISHRRLRGDDLVLSSGAFGRVTFDLDHDLSTFGLAQAFGETFHVGALIHALSETGVSDLRSTAFEVPAISGRDDIRFAASLGVVAQAPRREVGGGTLALRLGGALRRAGEDVDALFATPGGTEVARGEVVVRTIALGVGAQWNRGQVLLRLAGEYLDLDDDFAAGIEAVLHDTVTLRAGHRSARGGPTFGAGLRSPSWGSVRLTFDMAYEPGRFDATDVDRAWVFGLGLDVSLEDDPTDASLDDLFDDLDSLDDWIDGGLGDAAPDSTSHPEPTP